MPDCDYKDVDVSSIPDGYQQMGYDWIPDKFGPPPGIPRAEKERLDNLPDGEYVNAVLRKPLDDVESLMVSEAERRRSFRSTWDVEGRVKGVELAKSGFYFLNSSDRVKCAFCSGVIGQWKTGERPIERHRTCYPDCKFIRGEAQDNIPFNEGGGLEVYRRKKKENVMYDSSEMPSSIRFNIDDWEPWRNSHRNPQHRKQTFAQSWPSDLYHLIPKICDAGFFLVGPGDRCACFFCGGTLEDWAPNDDPWTEHARSYPSCPYLIQSQGKAYIQKVQDSMTDEEKDANRDPVYLYTRRLPKTKQEDKSEKVKKFQSYQYASIELEYPDELIMKAYECNDWKDYENPADLMQCIYKIQDG